MHKGQRFNKDHKTQDFNKDGHQDRIFHFTLSDSGINKDTTEACLTGETTDGTQFEGCDMITIVKTGKGDGGSDGPTNGKPNGDKVDNKKDKPEKDDKKD